MPDDWKAAGARIAAERARRWRRSEFAQATGLSLRTIENLESGAHRRYSAHTIGQVERCLGWEPGSIEGLVAGREPVYGDGPELRRIRDAWPHLSDSDRRTLADIAEARARDVD